MPEMSNGTSPSFLADLAHAVKSVGKTLLSMALLVVVIVLGVFLVGALVIITAFLWVGHKVRLIKEPPSVKFQRFQAKTMGKFIQWRLKKSGLGGKGMAEGGFQWPGGFGQGAPGSGPMGNPFQTGRPENSPDAQSIADAYQAATGQKQAQAAKSSDSPSSADVGEWTLDPEMEAEEVEAEPVQDELENFRGSLDEYLRMKGRRG
jgi:hypothetical protein